MHIKPHVGGLRGEGWFDSCFLVAPFISITKFGINGVIELLIYKYFNKKRETL